MFESKLIEVLLSFSTTEIQYFNKWYRSPIANQHDKVTLLFDFIYSKRNITPVSVRKEKAFAAVFPNTAFNAQDLRHVMSYALHVVEDFLAYQSFLQQRNAASLHLLSNYQKRNLPAHSKTIIDALAKQKASFVDSTYYLDQFELEKIKYEIASNNKRITMLNLQEVVDSLHYFTISETLRWACIALSHQQISDTAYDMHALPAYLELIEQNRYDSIPTIQIYYPVYKMMTTQEEIYFYQLKKQLLLHEKHFTSKELKDIYLLSINFCIKMSNKGKQQYIQELFDLYLHAIEKKYLIENNELSRFSFSNIVTNGIKLKEYAKTIAFIDTYQDYIHPDYRENTVAFNLSKVWSAQKQYKKAMPTLLQTEFKDVIWHLNAKHLLFKMLYETNEIELLQSQLSALKNYIKRQKNIGYHAAFFNAIIEQFLQLIAIQQAKKQEQKSLKINFLSNPDLKDKEWFAEILKQ